jgi:hypothetical protein
MDSWKDTRRTEFIRETRGKLSRLRLRVIKRLSPVTVQKAMWFDRVGRTMTWFTRDHFPRDSQLVGIEIGVV